MQKDQFTKFANAENSSDPNQDKVVVELREKKWGHRIATLIELKKASDITKQYLAECQTETVKLIQEKEISEQVIKIVQNFNTININEASEKELQIENM